MTVSETDDRGGRKVLAIGLDASSWVLVERWARDGTMPNLKRLYEQGSRARILSQVDWLAGTPWPSFYTGSYPPDHGFLFHLMWRPELQRHDRPRPDWLPMTPFYRRFGEFGKKVIAVDVPITYRAEQLDGVEITSWATHDKIDTTSSYPPDLIKKVEREIAPEPIPIETGGAQSSASLLRLRDSLVASANAQAQLCTSLMRQEPWDFCIVALGAAHRGGHKLWDRSSVSSMDPDHEGPYDNALRDIYVACDEAIGRMIEEAGPNVTVVCFALHGMGANTSRFDLVPEMLQRVLGEHGLAAPPRPKRTGLQGLRARVPVEWRSAVKERLPERVKDALSLFWRGTDARDWSRTRAFAPMGDLQALVQINLKGREAQGIVEPGREFEDLCDLITEGFMTFRDQDTGERIVDQIGRGDSLYPDARYDVGLPDLVIRWNDRVASAHRAVVSERYGSIPWPHPGQPLDGRSGHHGPWGWLLATGAGIEAGADLGDVSVFDLNAAIHEMVGVPKPSSMLGEPIPRLPIR